MTNTVSDDNIRDMHGLSKALSLIHILDGPVFNYTAGKALLD